MSLNILEIKNLLQKSSTDLEKKIKDISKEDLLNQIFGKPSSGLTEKSFFKSFPNFISPKISDLNNSPGISLEKK